MIRPPPRSLSTFEETSLLGSLMPSDLERPPVPTAGVGMFDACHVGVVLRAVLFVESVVAVAALFGASEPVDWLLRFSLMTGGVLPATLAWLIAACLLKARLNRLPPALQWTAGIGLGAAAGLYGVGLLSLMGLCNQRRIWPARHRAACLPPSC